MQSIHPQDIAQGDKFGETLVMNSEYAVACAIGDDNGAIDHTGSVYVFKKQSDGTWQELQKLQPNELNAFDGFGVSLAISEQFIFVGADYADTDADNESFMNAAGAVYVYQLDNTGLWQFHQKLVANDRQAVDWFGYSLAYDNNRLIVGAPGSDFDSNGENNLEAAGAVYVFTLNNISEFEQTQKLTADERKNFHQFGYFCAIQNNTIAVFGPDNIEETGNLDIFASIYFFEEDDNISFLQTQKIVDFGCTFARCFKSNFFFYEDFFFANIYLAAGYLSGVINIYKKNQYNHWQIHQQIESGVEKTNQNFGGSMSISNNTLIASSNELNIGPNGPDLIQNVGAAFVFELQDDQWTNTATISNPLPLEDDFFGYQVAISGNDILISTPFKRQNIVNGEPLSNAGILYHYKKDELVAVPQLEPTNQISFLFPNPSINGLVKFQWQQLITIDYLKIINAKGEILKTIDQPQNGASIYLPQNKGVYFALLYKNGELVQSMKGLF